MSEHERGSAPREGSDLQVYCYFSHIPIKFDRPYPEKSRTLTRCRRMKTTIELSDALFQRAKRVALERGMTLRALFEEALERIVGGTLDRATPLETITFGDALDRLPDIDFGRYANPDTDDPAYVAKRLGLESSPSAPPAGRGGRR